MDKQEEAQRERLITEMESLKDLTKRQVSFRFIFLRALVYGVGTVIGATILVSIISFVVTQVFGVDLFDRNVVQNIQEVGR